jgi:hypothetical protein
MECSMDMDMQHGFAAWTWIVDMHGCMDAGMLIKAQSGIVSFPLVYNA